MLPMAHVYAKTDFRFGVRDDGSVRECLSNKRGVIVQKCCSLQYNNNQKDMDGLELIGYTFISDNF